MAKGPNLKIGVDVGDGVRDLKALADRAKILKGEVSSLGVDSTRTSDEVGKLTAALENAGKGLLDMTQAAEGDADAMSELVPQWNMLAGAMRNVATVGKEVVSQENAKQAALKETAAVAAAAAQAAAAAEEAAQVATTAAWAHGIMERLRLRKAAADSSATLQNQDHMNRQQQRADDDASTAQMLLNIGRKTASAEQFALREQQYADERKVLIAEQGAADAVAMANRIQGGIRLKELAEQSTAQLIAIKNRESEAAKIAGQEAAIESMATIGRRITEAARLKAIGEQSTADLLERTTREKEAVRQAEAEKKAAREEAEMAAQESAHEAMAAIGRRVTERVRLEKNAEESTRNLKKATDDKNRADSQAQKAIDKTNASIKKLTLSSTMSNQASKKSVQELRNLRAMLLRLIRNTDQYNRELIEESGVLDQVNSKLNQHTGAMQRAGKATRGYSKTFGRVNAVISNASFAVQDFVTVLQGGGGLERAVLSTTNNIGMMASLALPGLTGALIGVGSAVAVAVVPRLIEMSGLMDDASAQTEKAKEKAEDYATALEAIRQGHRASSMDAIKYAASLNDTTDSTDRVAMAKKELKEKIDSVNKAISSTEGEMKRNFPTLQGLRDSLHTASNALEEMKNSGNGNIRVMAATEKRIQSLQKEITALNAPVHLSEQHFTLLKGRLETLNTAMKETGGVGIMEAREAFKDLQDELKTTSEDEKEAAMVAVDATRERMISNLNFASARGEINAQEKKELLDLIELRHQEAEADVDKTIKTKEEDKTKAKEREEARREKEFKKLQDNLKTSADSEKEAGAAKIQVWKEEQRRLLDLAKTRNQVTQEEEKNLRKLIDVRAEEKLHRLDDKVEKDRVKKAQDVQKELSNILDDEHSRAMQALWDQKQNLAARAQEAGVGGARLVAAMQAIQDQIDAIGKKAEDEKKPLGQPDTFEERLDKINAQRAASGQDPIHAGSRQGRDIQRQVNQEQKDFGAQQREQGKGMGGRMKKWQRFYETQGGMGLKGGRQKRWDAIQEQVGMIPVPEGAGAQNRRQRGLGEMAGGAVGAGMKLGPRGGGQETAQTLSILGLNQQTGQMNNAMLQKIIKELAAYKKAAMKQLNDTKKNAALLTNSTRTN